jgi:hypothetical protein
VRRPEGGQSAWHRAPIRDVRGVTGHVHARAPWQGFEGWRTSPLTLNTATLGASDQVTKTDCHS